MINAAIPLQVRKPSKVNAMGEMMQMMQMKNAMQQSKMQQSEFDRKNALRAALAETGGDLGKMREVYASQGDIKNVTSIDKHERDILKSQRDAEAHQVEMALKKTDAISQLLGAAQSPESYAAVRQRVMAIDPDAAMPEVFDPTWVQQNRMMGLKVSEQLGHALAQARFGEQKRHNLETEKKSTGMAFSVGPDGVVSFASGGARMPLGTKPTTDAQATVAKGQGTLRRLDRIWQNFDPKFFTLQGKAQGGVATIADMAGRASLEQKQFLNQHQRLKQSVKREFNVMRKEVTGAGAAMAELKDLADGMFSMDMTPTTFEAGFREYRRATAMAVQLSQKLLREGLRLGTGEYQAKMDELWLEGRSDPAVARGWELEAEGLNDEQIIERLTQEGLIK